MCAHDSKRERSRRETKDIGQSDPLARSRRVAKLSNLGLTQERAEAWLDQEPNYDKWILSHVTITQQNPAS